MLFSAAVLRIAEAKVLTGKWGRGPQAVEQTIVNKIRRQTLQNLLKNLFSPTDSPYGFTWGQEKR